MPLKEYLAALDAQYRTGQATEHSYRPALQAYLQELLPGHLVTNEPTRTACGAPDYVIATRANGLPVAYVEAKDIDDPDLKGLKAHREQFDWRCLPGWARPTGGGSMPPGAIPRGDWSTSWRSWWARPQSP